MTNDTQERIPLEQGLFLGLRFGPELEHEFRADYRRAFHTRTAALWTFASSAWLGAALADGFFFPGAPTTFLVLRLTGLLVLFATTFFAATRGDDARLHLVTTCAATAVGLCTVGLFALVAFPENWPTLLALSSIGVISTIFVSTLHFEYSVMGSAVTWAAFTIAALLQPALPIGYAVGFSLGIAVIFTTSLSCTNTIEQYARKNFAQRLLLERQSAALAEKAEQLAIEEAKARDANLAKSVFLSNMSHELRTPLNAVLGFAQLLQRDPTLSASNKETLGIIERSGDHLLALINDVLAISKIEAGRITLSEQTFDLHSMIKSVTDMIKVRTDLKGISLLVSIEPDVPVTVSGDEGKLRQVLVNLLGNAVKFTEAGGIALRVGWTGETLLVEAEDTGFGIAPEEIGALFEAFAQTESGRRSKEGTGLGLAISANFVQMMGGEIRVDSELGTGSTFSVKVPLRLADALEVQAAARQVAGLAEDQEAVRLLVVDDTLENRLLLSRLLTEVGFLVREATNGEEAIQLWRDWEPHLIWMDMRMPVMDGYDATKKIREMDGPPVKIIALTASAFQHEREKILSMGCDGFVTKPFRSATLFETLTEHLGVQFRYDDDAPEDSHQEMDLAKDRIAALPSEVVDALRHAMLTGNVKDAHDSVELIHQHDEPLAAQLGRLIRAFRFDEVLDAIE